MITTPGAFVVVQGRGVLLLGRSGIGKSDCALELTRRGHVFVADDCVRIEKAGPGNIIGSTPCASGFPCHIRGLGILDMEKIFGSDQVQASYAIDLVIRLENWQKGQFYTDICPAEKFHTLLDGNIALISIPVTPDRDLATLVEVAVKQKFQKKSLTEKKKTALAHCLI